MSLSDSAGFASGMAELEALDVRLRGADYLATWERSLPEVRAILAAAACLASLHKRGLSAVCFSSGMGVSIFRDNSTRTRYSYSAALNLLGLEEYEVVESSSQMAHGETVRETANMVSFLTETIGIRDDIYLGKGEAFMREVAAAVEQGFRDGVLHQRPSVINLQSDVDHPTQSMADLAHLVERASGLEELKGRKVAVTWAYSPSYGKPLSVPQGVIGLLTRLGCRVSLAHPPGYDLIPAVVERARAQAKESGGSFEAGQDMDEAFRGADVVYPKSWAPYGVMERRSALRGAGKAAELKELEREGLAQNARHQDWECTEQKMALTAGGQALYMHCLPADITGVSCRHGEVAASVFARASAATYRQASWKPFVIAAVILLTRSADPVKTLASLRDRKEPRV
jgi:knotted carbamoyltransferase YgeW